MEHHYIYIEFFQNLVLVASGMILPKAIITDLIPLTKNPVPEARQLPQQVRGRQKSQQIKTTTTRGLSVGKATHTDQRVIESTI